MKTSHKIIFSDASRMKEVPDESVDLIVTSPPYPMIQMWDHTFSERDSRIRCALDAGRGLEAFDRMHQALDPIWAEAYRVLSSGGFACINIGDATRTIEGNFRLYPNHARVLTALSALGFHVLPEILWRKQTNAPNKFMGSGMLPAGAYVTFEHEYILIARKGGKREFRTETEKKARRESAMFWEERNVWYSDVWFDIKGTPQNLQRPDVRRRSAAYPFELAYRLVNMYSVKGDLVLDPFLGTGTSTFAAMTSARNSIGYEIDPGLQETICRPADDIVGFSNDYIRKRLRKHTDFLIDRMTAKSDFKYENKRYGFPVKTNQEKDILISDLVELTRPAADTFAITYADEPQKEFCGDWPLP
jgi:modification methylase